MPDPGSHYVVIPSFPIPCKEYIPNYVAQRTADPDNALT